MKLSTGKEFRVEGAGRETLGLSADLQVTEGYDHDNDQWEGHSWDDPAEALTVSEKVEVCDVMIARWSKLKSNLQNSNE